MLSMVVCTCWLVSDDHLGVTNSFVSLGITTKEPSYQMKNTRVHSKQALLYRL